MRAALLLLFLARFSVVAQEATNFVGFPKQSFTVNEAVPSVQVRVERLGDTNATVSVDYLVSAGVGAEADKDFTAAQGTLSFGPGETNRSISIAILDDEIPESAKFIDVTLTNLVGDSVLTNGTASVRLIDNDGRANGIDPAFRFGYTNVAGVNDLLLVPDGKIWFGAAAAGVNGVSYGILDQNGSPSYGIFAGGQGTSWSIALNRDESVIVGFKIGNSPVNRAPISYPEFPFLFAHQNLTGDARKVLIDQNDRIIAAGNFVMGGETNSFGLAALNASGTIDSSFETESSLNLTIDAAVLEGDGRILAGYTTTNESGRLMFGFGRWNRDGSRDTNDLSMVLTNVAPEAHITVIEPELKTGAFLMAVEYQDEAEGTLTRIVRLLPLGIVDAAFELPLVHGKVNAIALHAWLPESLAAGTYDNILIGGEFTGAGSFTSKNIISLKRNGELAWAIAPEEGPDGAVRVIRMQSDGSILVGGMFSEFSGFSSHGLVRLQGLKAENRTFVYFDREEFRGYEKNGFIDLTAWRAGVKTNEPVSLSLSVAAGQGGALSDLAALPASIDFAVGETQKVISIPVFNNSLVQGKKYFDISFGSADTNLSLTRWNAQFVILDDETPGTRDPKFSSVPPRQSPLSVGSINAVVLLAAQPDGKILFSYSDRVSKLGRMNPDGSLDPTFVMADLAYASPFTTFSDIEVQPDGKIYVAGWFLTTPTDYGTNLLMRLNPDGSLDSGFNPRLKTFPATEPTGINFAVQADGSIFVSPNDRIKVMLQGAFGSVSIFKLKPDGTQDTSFKLASSFTSYSKMVLDPKGRLIAASQSSLLTRFTPTGVVDTNFTANVRGSVYSLVVVGNSLYIGGQLRMADQTGLPSLLKLNLEDGSTDTNFFFNADREVTQILPLKNGKLLVGGNFTRVNGADRYRLVRINSDGSVDASFDAGFGPNDGPTALLEQPDHKVLVAGGINKIDLVPVTGLIRLEDVVSPGVLRLVSKRVEVFENQSFALIEIEREGGSQGALTATVETFDQSALAGSDYVSTNVTIQFADGEFGRKAVQVPLIANGSLTGNRTVGIRLISATTVEEGTLLIKDSQAGSFDSGFNLSVIGGTNPPVRDFFLASEGKVIVAGTFTNVQGTNSRYLARLNPDLSADVTFTPPVPNNYLNAMALDLSNRIIISGPFTRLGTSNIAGIARLKEDLTIDTAFNPAHLFSGSFAIGLLNLPGGQILAFNSSGSARFNLDGTTDPSWKPTGLGSVNTMLPLESGKVLCGLSRNGKALIRVSHEGTVETNFNLTTAIGTFQTASVRAIAVEKNGNILIGGDFDSLNSTPLPRLARISPEGFLDMAFQPRIGTNNSNAFSPALNYVGSITILDDGDILVGGNFLTVAGQSRPFLARLAPDGSLRPEFKPTLQGDRVDKIKALSDGSVIVIGGITNVNGADVDGIFKLGFPMSLPPFVQITSLTNGQTIYASDVVPYAYVDVQAFDPDGFLKEVRVAFDGEVISTNQFGPFHVPLAHGGSGSHTVTAYAEDESGLVSTNSVTISIAVLPFPSTMEILRTENGFKIRWLGGDYRLEATEDFVTWTTVQTNTPGEYVISEMDTHPTRFFRLAF